jgi:hypothetical protein
MAFEPPVASKRQLDGIPFDLAVDFAPAAKKRFADKDNLAGNRDPSNCKALLKFPDNGTDRGAVFWSSKMAIDADGPAAGSGRLKGTELDPDSGQNDTNLHFADGNGLPSEAVPYIVLPQLAPHSPKGFDPAVEIGDVAIVIFKDKVTAAICGDVRPFDKIGEASIHVHEAVSRSLFRARCQRLLQPCPQLQRGARRIVFRVSQFCVRQKRAGPGNDQHQNQ